MNASPLLVALVLALPAAGPPPRAGGHHGHPHVDVLSTAVAPAEARRAVALAAGPLLHPERPLHLQAQLGVPTFLWARPGAGAPAALLATLPETAARAHLERYASLYRLVPADAQAARHLSTHVTASGASVVRLAQEVDGVEVFHGRMTLLLAPAGDLVAIGGYFSPSASRLAAVGGRLSFALDAESALVRAFADLGGGWLSAAALSRQGTLADGSVLIGHAGTPPASLALAHPARARPVAFETGTGLEPAWYLELDVAAAGSTSPELVASVISARDGRLLYREPLTVEDAFTYRVYADTTPPFTPWDGPQGTAGTPYPTAAPSGYAPPLAPMTSDVTLQNAPFSRNDPWLPAGATETVGNNVDAYVDVVPPDGYTPTTNPNATDFRATSTTAGAFQNGFNPLGSPTTMGQRKAILQQLFFMTNWLHDLYYDLGFDEAAGNAQADNFGRGGVGGDRLLAEGQDGSGTNNANMSTPADGASPRMQMYVWTAPAPDRDGGLDTGIAGHEWHHYLVGRLVAGGMGSNMAGGLNEGFADFGALLLIVRPGDTGVASNAGWGGAYATGGYATSGLVGDSYYYGVRRFPYSTDLARDPLTYQHIQTGASLPSSAPRNLGLASPDNAEVHNEGEIWGSMLWDCYAALLQDSTRLTFDGAQRRMRGYLVTGLKLMPSSPTFVEARDAMLAAIYAGDPADYALCGAAFARRGLGSGAISPERYSTSNAGLVESFVFGNDVALVSAALDDTALTCDADHYVDPGERGRLTVTARNTGAAALAQLAVTLTSTNPAVVFPGGPTASFPALAPFATASAVVEVAYLGATSRDTTAFDVALADPTLVGGKVVHGTLAAVFDADDRPASSATEGFDTVATTWTPGHGTGASTPAWRREGPPGLGRAVGPDPDAQVDQWFLSPVLQVPAGGAVSFTLSHAWDFEADPEGTIGRLFYDGGRIEYSTDGGTTWTDVGSGAVAYPGTISPYAGSKNVLAGAAAFVGRSPGWPAMVSTTVNLDRTAATTIRLRFRVATDEAAGAGGWIIDSVAFTGLAGTPFDALAANVASCLPNRAPVASAGPAQTVDERTSAALDGSASSDPDGDAFNLLWSQLSGPAVTLSSSAVPRPGFTVPEVTADTTATFQLVVTDAHGLASAPSTVTLTFRDVNRPPVADAGPGQAVDEGSSATLDGSASSDPDGDALGFAWTQTSGPPVTLSSGAVPRPAFTTLGIPVGSVLTFSLVVTDSRGLPSAPAAVLVTIRPVNHPPQAVAVGGSVQERWVAVLDATGSSDPEGDLLTFSWTQLSGPPVALMGADTATPFFSAPEVTADTALVFQVTVSDGRLSATAQATMTVLQVNRPPSLSIVLRPQPVIGVVTVTLDGSGTSDPDGDALTFSWRQGDGPAVTLSGADSSVATFQSPAVATDTAMVFILRASDGTASMSEATWVIVSPTALALPPPARASGCGCTSAGDASPIALLGLALAGGLLRRRQGTAPGRARQDGASRA